MQSLCGMSRHLTALRPTSYSSSQAAQSIKSGASVNRTARPSWEQWAVENSWSCWKRSMGPRLFALCRAKSRLLPASLAHPSKRAVFPKGQELSKLQWPSRCQGRRRRSVPSLTALGRALLQNRAPFGELPRNCAICLSSEAAGSNPERRTVGTEVRSARCQP